MESGKNNNKGLGEVSFSCYLKTEENFVQKLTGSAHYPNHSITSGPEFPSSRSFRRIKVDREAEIGVFDAEKYYNMKLDEGPKIIGTAASDHAQVDLLRPNIKSRPGTPSASSEASWNSQAALLRTYQRNLSQGKKQTKLHGKGFFSVLGVLGCINGSCSDEKSVGVNQNVELEGLVQGKDYRKERIQTSARTLDGRKQLQQPIFKVDKYEFYKPSFEKMNIDSNKDEFFSIPIAKSGIQNLAVQKTLAKKIEEEESRKSLDVFGSHTLKKEFIEMNLRRKLSMLSWDAIPNAPSLPASSARGQVYEDVESDASSDLFEIENISANTGQHPVFIRRQTSDDGMSTPYEPSETSTEWSVVTPTAADYSVVSHYDEKKMTENIRISPTTPSLATAAGKLAKTKFTDKDVQGSRPSKLLGCKSHNAVRVAEAAYRINNDKAKSHPHPQQPLRSVAPMPVRKFIKADNGELVFDFP